MAYGWVKILLAWITAAGVFLLSVIYPLRLYCNRQNLSSEHWLFRVNCILRKIHKPLGILIIPLSFLHCRFSSQKLGLNIGTVLLSLLFLLLLTYVLRKRTKGRWLTLHRSLTAAFWLLLVFHIVFDTERINDFMLELIGLDNVYWYYLGYGILTMVVMRCIPKEKRGKILTYAPQGSMLEKLSAFLNTASRYAAMVLSVFLPMSWNPFAFWVGNALYAIGLVLSTVAMWQFSKEDLDRPITTGLYRVSRNPMHVMGFVMNIGIALVANNLLFWICVAINIVASYPMFFMQERFCIDRYGKEYEDYMKRTPRILFIKSNG